MSIVAAYYFLGSLVANSDVVLGTGGWLTVSRSSSVQAAFGPSFSALRRWTGTGFLFDPPSTAKWRGVGVIAQGNSQRVCGGTR